MTPEKKWRWFVFAVNIFAIGSAFVSGFFFGSGWRENQAIERGLAQVKWCLPEERWRFFWVDTPEWRTKQRKKREAEEQVKRLREEADDLEAMNRN